MFNLIGIDIGNRLTKTSTGTRFYSTSFVGHKDLNKDEIKVKYQGKLYTVGSKNGTAALGDQRIHHITYDLCLLTAIGLSRLDERIEEEVVVSLPPEQFESNLRKQLRDKLSKLGTQEIEINGVKKFISITKSDVFSEAAIVWTNPAKYREQKTIFIDIGGGTADITEYNGMKLINHATEPLGMVSLFTEMKKAINARYMSKLSIDDMEDFFGKDMVEIKQEMSDISFTNDVVRAHVMKICNVVNQNFNVDACKFELLGGGAAQLLEFFREKYPHIELVPDSQFVNAKTNATVGAVWFSGK